MCMSLSLASFVSLTGPGELWRNLLNTVMRDLVKSVVNIEQRWGEAKCLTIDVVLISNHNNACSSF